MGSFVENVGRCCIQGPGTLVLYNAGLSPYRPVSFDGIVKIGVAVRLGLRFEGEKYAFFVH